MKTNHFNKIKSDCKMRPQSEELNLITYGIIVVLVGLSAIALEDLAP